MKPISSEALLQQAQSAFGQGELTNAVELLRRCLATDAKNTLAATNLCLVLGRLGLFPEAKMAGLNALALAPESVPALINTSVALQALGELDDAEALLLRAAKLAPNNSDIWDCLSLGQQQAGRFVEALQSLRKAITIAPENANAAMNYGLLLQKLGHSESALFWAQKALSMAPEDRTLAQNYLMFRQYVLNGNSEQEVQQTCAVIARAYPPVSHLAVKPRTANTVKIGLISADFYRHPVGYFLIGVLAELAAQGIELVLYMNQRNQDGLTDKLVSHASKVTNVIGISDRQLAEMIMADELTCLIDLSGHSKGNRLGALLYKPCPKQFSWLGYFASTGLTAIDAVILGEFQYVNGVEKFYSEAIAVMKGSHFTYTPPEHCPDIAQRPAIEQPGVTFGSFNNLAKLNERLLDTWSKILLAVPNSRLILKWSTFIDAGVIEEVTRAFEIRGVSKDVIICRASSEHYAMLNEYNDVDICLDPFPFNGGLTTCEALWMGVPVISLAGVKPVSRQSKGILDAIGLSDLVVTTERCYVQKAVALAADTKRRDYLRQSLRGRMEQSPLMDYKTMANSLLAIVKSDTTAWLS
ncbi:hypothetical protein BFC17_02625 [Alteromonas lipolytica]|uniref:protein O-GlcNAc transferase n=2 Tax=Alteromonas lipolytica TaxID=1856405 RepID=A0A1E8FCE5_9ALTE|nr:hypothetical protein BFC17_02625 [Alteromonas lipolytica]